MKDLATTCVLRAHKAIRSNPLVLWFPMLFSVTAGVFYILFFFILMSPYLPGIGKVDALLFSQEMMELALGRILALGFVAVVLLIIMTAGTLGLQAGAVRGDSLETGDYFRSVRRFFLPVLGGQIVTTLAYALPIAVLAVLFVTGPFFANFEGTYLSEADLTEVLGSMAPAFLLASLAFAVLAVFFSMWPKIVALEQRSLFRALAEGIKFVWGNLGVIVMIVGGGWLITFFIRLLLEGSAFGSLLQLGLGFAVRSYVAIALMNLYLIKTEEQ